MDPGIRCVLDDISTEFVHADFDGLSDD